MKSKKGKSSWKVERNVLHEIEEGQIPIGNRKMSFLAPKHM
ncbi:hypothetical protein V7103_05395 [Neobacillus drentensis]